MLKEFEGLYSELVERAGINVSVFSHSSSHNTPDAVFPNNWFSTHNGKTMCLYPMKVEKRSSSHAAFFRSFYFSLSAKVVRSSFSIAIDRFPTDKTNDERI